MPILVILWDDLVEYACVNDPLVKMLVVCLNINRMWAVRFIRTLMKNLLILINTGEEAGFYFLVYYNIF